MLQSSRKCYSSQGILLIEL
uniref:Uncharacterized protein n=1 Tax=Arundo donax TaxID=35708 RepID=A0A0A9B1Y6_ARUDO